MHKSGYAMKFLRIGRGQELIDDLGMTIIYNFVQHLSRAFEFGSCSASMTASRGTTGDNKEVELQPRHRCSFRRPPVDITDGSHLVCCPGGMSCLSAAVACCMGSVTIKRGQGILYSGTLT